MQNPDCAISVLCGDACFLKKARMPSDRKQKPDCATLAVKPGTPRLPRKPRPRSSHHPWLPPVTPAEQFLSAIPKGTGKDQTEAWEIFKRRLRHNIASTEWAAAVLPAAGQSRPLSILLVDSAIVVFKMNWMTGEHIQWGDIRACSRAAGPGLVSCPAALACAEALMC